MDFYYVYSKLFLEFSACIYNIILQIFLTFRYNGNSRSNMFFRRLINYVIYATSFDIASTLIISSFNNINYGLALVMYCLQTVLTIFVSYYLSCYTEIYIYGNEKKTKLHIFNQIFLYGILSVLLFYIITSLLLSYHPAGNNFLPPLLKRLLETIIPLYYTFYSMGLIFFNWKKYKRAIFTAIMISYTFFLFGLLLEIFLGKVLRIGYLGLSLGLFILFFTVEFPDYNRMMSTLSDLSKAKKEANLANEAKSTFLSNMSHEIRTPLNAILGLDEIIIRQSNDPEIHKYAMDIHNAGQSLLSIINDILDFSKIEAQKLEILPGEYALSSIINDLNNMVKPKIKEKNLTYKLNIDPTIPSVLYGDSVRIKQIILNLLTNAIKYTPSGSILFSIKTIERDEITTTLHVSIKDSGIGMKKSDMEKLFSPFERLEEKRNRTIEGSGLGITIVSRLLALMNSSLEVKSVYNQGSEFSFKLAQRIIDPEPIGESYINYATKTDDLYKIQIQAPFATILAVDDTEMNLVVLKGLLKSTKIQIDTATSGMEMLTMITKKHYDLIFIDHRMPIMDGVEALHQMDTFPHLCKDTPCIILTANVIQGAKEQYISEGFVDYLSKPINTARLENVIIQHLDNSKIIYPDDIGYENYENTKNNSLSNIKQSTISTDTIGEVYENIVDGISFDEAQKNCGTVELWLESTKTFYKTIPSLAKELTEYLDNEDIENYTIKVHALKSSARLIGAMELSHKALKLENYGNEGNIDKIKELSPAMIVELESYIDKLSVLCPKIDESVKESISVSDLNNAYNDILECLEAFDFTIAENILNSLEKYKLPENEETFFKELSDCILFVKRDEAIKILKDRKN